MGMQIGLNVKRELLLKAELHRIVPIIKKLGVDKIILFGSLNEKKVGKSSDIDIAIIWNTRKSFSDRLEELYTTVMPKLAIDFFVYTPSEIKKLEKTSHFVKKMLEKGKIIYETGKEKRGRSLVNAG